MTDPLVLSVLDQTPVSEGSTGGDALRNTIDLAQLADELGYRRYWLAEHHNGPLPAGPSPEVLIGPVAMATSRIRVGSGGVMLPHYSPLKVAESFSVLAGLFGDRIDVVVESVVDRRRADPESVRAEVHLAPYEAFGARRKTITTEGRFARVTFTYPVACLSLDCIPEAGETIPTESRITFPPARVDYRDAKKTRHTLSVVVPPVRLVARAVPRNQSGAQTFFRDPIEDLRAPARTLHTSYWTSPTLLGALLLGGGALALGLAGLLLVPAARRLQDALRPVTQGPSTTPLEDAIALVERTSAEQPGSTEHREALARLVRELRAAGLASPALAGIGELPAGNRRGCRRGPDRRSRSGPLGDRSWRGGHGVEVSLGGRGQR